MTEFRNGGARKACRRTARPSEVHPRRAPRRSYHIGDVLVALVIVAAALSVCWGYPMAFQAGMSYQEEVSHAQR